MSDYSSDSGDSFTYHEPGVINPFKFEPLPKEKVPIHSAAAENEEPDEEQDDIFNPGMIDQPKPVQEWCECGCCQQMPTVPESICCHGHDISDKLHDRGQIFKCITLHPGTIELTMEAPLEVAWTNYLCYHPNILPGATANQRKRLCSYRNLVFWCWPDIRRKERRPLPACLVSMVRAMFPPTDNEEEFADWAFKGFCYTDEQ